MGEVDIQCGSSTVQYSPVLLGVGPPLAALNKDHMMNFVDKMRIWGEDTDTDCRFDARKL